jgi:hypothetical protein
MNKEKRFLLESELISLIYDNNKNTPHFNYRVNIDAYESVTLELFTYNVKNNEVFLLAAVSGKNTEECLIKMIKLVKSRQAEPHSFTVEWENLVTGKKALSYFYETSEENVIEKFFFNKNREEYKIRIIPNPIS